MQSGKRLLSWVTLCLDQGLVFSSRFSPTERTQAQLPSAVSFTPLPGTPLLLTRTPSSGPGPPFWCIPLCYCVFRDIIYFSFHLFNLLWRRPHTQRAPSQPSPSSPKHCTLTPTVSSPSGSAATSWLSKGSVLISTAVWAPGSEGGEVHHSLPLKSHHQDHCSLKTVIGM